MNVGSCAPCGGYRPNIVASSLSHDDVEAALQRAGSTWSAAQAHGLLCGAIAVRGSDGAAQWLGQVLDGSDPANALHQEGAGQLNDLASETYRSLAERQSEFEPLLPEQTAAIAELTAGLAQWCEGFLHGLVSHASEQALKDRLAAEPISDIIKDMVEITRAEADDSDDADQEAITELIEYLRVTTQLVYEELSILRHADDDAGTSIH